MKTAQFICLFFLFLCTVSAFSQAGNLDPDFGNGDGFITTAIYPDAHCSLNDVAVQQDGKILVTGGTNVPGGLGEAVLMRLMPDGSFDNMLNGSGKIILSNPNSHSSAYSSIIQPDGKIVTLVNYSNTSLDSFSLFRFLPDGTPDNTFDNDGVVYTNLGIRYQSGNSLLIQPDGKLVIGGYIQGQTDTFDQFFIVRYKMDGSLDETFDGDGIVITKIGNGYGNLNKILLQPDGKIIAVGYATINGSGDFAVVRYNGNGSLDGTFNNDGIVTVSFSVYTDYATGVVLQPDGKVVAVGLASHTVGNTEFAVARFTANGFLDNTFHGDGLVTIPVSIYPDAASSVLIQPDGKLIIGGYTHSNASGSDMAIVRLTETGIPDFTFDEDGIATFHIPGSTSNEISELAWQPDGKIVAVGGTRIGNFNNIAVIRVISGITLATHDEMAPALHVAIYPNPMIDNVTVEYELKHEATIGINIHDVQARYVETLMPSLKRNAGRHTETLHIQQSLSPGTYFLNIESAHWVKSVKVCVQ